MLQNDLREAMKDAMRQKDAVRLSVIRGLLTAATNELIAKGKKPTDELSAEDMTAVIRRAAKQRKDSIDQFQKGGRDDLAQKEQVELAVLDTMLPPMLSREEVEAAVKAKAAALGTDVSKKNQLMGAVMQELKGKADGTVVKEVVDALFA